MCNWFSVIRIFRRLRCSAAKNQLQFLANWLKVSVAVSQAYEDDEACGG